MTSKAPTVQNISKMTIFWYVSHIHCRLRIWIRLVVRKTSLLNNDHELARNTLASLLTRKRGEYILRLGVQPPRDVLFAGEPLDNVSSWTGVSRTVEDIDAGVVDIEKVVGEIGGKVCQAIIRTLFCVVLFYRPSQVSVLFRIGGSHPRVILLLRLPPPSVASTPEVRCAVVGNVDSGKSTTLGVLTRGIRSQRPTLYIISTLIGALDDGRGRARVALFRHKHEIETGRTSSVGMEVCSLSHCCPQLLTASCY